MSERIPGNHSHIPKNSESEYDITFGKIQKKDTLQEHNDVRDSISVENPLEVSETSENDLGSEESFDDGYDENYIGDELDQKYLESLNEKEREQEIFDRMEKRELLLTRHEIRRKLNLKKNYLKKKDYLEEEEYSTKRKKTTSQNKSLSELVSLRQKKKSQRMTNVSQNDKLDSWHNDSIRLKASEVFSDEEYDDDHHYDDNLSDSVQSYRYQVDPKVNDFDQSDETKHSSKSAIITTRNEVECIRISRYRLEKWAFMPFFAETIKGCFVRVSIGANNGVAVYRIAEIVDVVESTRSYTSGTVTTNKLLRLRCASSERTFRIDVISNQPFTDVEFEIWKKDMLDKGMDLPAISLVKTKQHDLKVANNFEVSDSEAQKIVEEKLKYRRVPVNVAIRKQELFSKLHQAQYENDHSLVSSINSELNSLEEITKEREEERLKSLSHINQINERNRRRNHAALEQALLEDSRPTGPREDDPFTRRKTIPTILNMSHQPPNVKSTDSSVSLEIQSHDKCGILENTSECNAINDKKRESNKSSYDVLKVHDFELNIELPTKQSDCISTRRPSLDVNENKFDSTTR